MPPTWTARTPTGDGHSPTNMYFDAAVFRQLTTAQLQELCQRNSLSALGRRTALENRLKNAGIAPAAAPNVQPVNRQIPYAGLTVQQRANPSAFTEEQITEIKRLVQDSVAAAAGDIATEAARAVTGTDLLTGDSISPDRQPRYPWRCCHFRPTRTTTTLASFPESTTKRWAAHINAMPSRSTFSGDSGKLC